jgi:hypothetical protein
MMCSGLIKTIPAGPADAANLIRPSGQRKEIHMAITRIAHRFAIVADLHGPATGL